MHANFQRKPTTRYTRVKSQKGVQICVIPASVVLEEASIGAIPHSYEERFGIRAERHTRDFPEKVNLLLFVKSIFHIIDVHKISWLCHRHKLPISCKTN